MLPIYYNRPMAKTRRHLRAKGKTAPGTHRPIMVREVLAALDLQPEDSVVDCTLGYGGHAEQFLRQLGPRGRLIGLDVDAGQLERTARRLRGKGEITTVCTNFRHLRSVLDDLEVGWVSAIFADLGMSSMQVDDPARGFSYRADGPLDMRMDPQLQTTAADLLASLSRDQLSKALWDLSDEPDHEQIAEHIVGRRLSRPITTVDELRTLVLNVKGYTEKTWLKEQKQAGFNSLHPAARTFQTLRILVNDELSGLRDLLAQLPECLAPDGRVGILSFHSGEDRLVKNAFRDGRQNGLFETVSQSPLTPRTGELMKNPRSASAKFRWARRT